MVCPLCRKITKFSDNRVEGLPANVTVNGLVDEHVGDQGGMNAVLELHLLCTTCESKEAAISFCRECNNYMCDTCHHGHQRMVSLFVDHQIVSVTDIKSGKVTIHQQADRCKAHKNESKDLFCEDCKVHICFKCVIVGHRDHKIKNKEDFETELRIKVDDLLRRCTAKKTDLEKNIQNTEIMRHDVHAAVQKLENEVKDAYEKKAKRLKENERALLEEIKSLRDNFDGKFDVIKTHDRQQIKSIVNSVTLVANDRLGRLETDSLSAHSLLCEELETLLGEATNVSSAKHVKQVAKRHRFRPASDEILDLGTCSEKMVQLRVTKEVRLSHNMSGMSALSTEAVAVGYGNKYYGRSVDTRGTERTLFSVDLTVYDIVIKKNKKIVVSRTPTELFMFDNYGMKEATQVVKNYTGIEYPRISSNHEDEIVLANRVDRILIYDSSASSLKCTISTENKPMQAFETRSGAIVSSSCDVTPSVITVYDRNGRTGSSLRANEGEYLYATVDCLDRVYVAIVNPSLGTVVIKLYEVHGLELEETAQSQELKLSVPDKWCYLVSLSRTMGTMLALASGNKLSFLEVELR